MQTTATKSAVTAKTVFMAIIGAGIGFYASRTIRGALIGAVIGFVVSFVWQ